MRILVCITLFAVLLTAHANELPQPKVEYSADSTMEAEGMRMQTRIHRGVDKERREMKMGGQQQIMILRMDKGLAWMLMPESRSYMEMPIGTGLSSSGDFTGYDIESTMVGKETLNGMATTKYRAELVSPDGIRAKGFMWISKEGLLVKVDARATGPHGGSKVRLELTNIKLRRQDPKLFEIPAGYKKFDIRSFGGME